MPSDLTPTEARERLTGTVSRARTRTLHRLLGGAAPPGDKALKRDDDLCDAILATTDALAVLVTWPALLAAGERAGKVATVEEWESFCDHEAQIAGRRRTGRITYRLTDPEAAP